MTVAEKIIKPTKAGIFRIVFLYTGQVKSTLMVIPTGSNVSDYMYILVDCDRDKETNEIDLVEMMKDLFKTSGKLEIFINTHPHNDHIGGIKDVYEEIGFTEVWHSNHKPGPKHKDKYEDLKYVIEKSAVNPDELVKKPGTDEKVNLSELSKTGGLVNAFEAIKLAATLKSEAKQVKQILPKPKLSNNKKG